MRFLAPPTPPAVVDRLLRPPATFVAGVAGSLGALVMPSGLSGLNEIASCPGGQRARGDGSCEPLAGAAPPCPESEADRTDGCIAPDGHGVWSRQAAGYLDVSCPQGMAPDGSGKCYRAMPDKGFFTWGRILTLAAGAALGLGGLYAVKEARRRKLI